MMESTPTQALVDLAPALRLALLAALLALVPLAWVWLRRRGDGVTTSTRLATLTALTLFLTFDLVVFGAFTRLTDSGLGCPDWPGCYGQASPLGAASEISAAESAAPSGKVTWHKAWIEMIHRYLAMTVGVLILVMAAVSWRERFSARKTGLPFSPWWPTATLAWLRTAAAVAFAVLGVQIALGGWVSTNVAVLACTGFPQCNGQWWPEMSGAGFVLLRELGHAADGSGLPYEAMIAIHMAHRVFAVVAALVLAALAWVLWRVGGEVGRFGAALAAVLVVQMASGLSNVVLGWPLIAALAHSAGAAALVLLLALLLARSARAPRLASQPASLGPLAA
jgi:cytochrome c oxidase assembly protein subunit 15